MKHYTIERKGDGKGRSFSAHCLAVVEADSLWPGGATDKPSTLRPVFAMFAGTDDELRPFVANLRSGRRAETSGYGFRHRGERLEFLKSAGYEVSWQREVEGSVATVFLPDLFRLDPGMVDPAGISFVLLPSTDWERAQKFTGAVSPEMMATHAVVMPQPEGSTDLEVDESLVAAAHLFAAYLDRRTRCPLIADGRFYCQLLRACVAIGLAEAGQSRYQYGRSSHGFRSYGLDDVGIARAIAFRSTHEVFEELLAAEVAKWFAARPVEVVERHRKVA